MTTNIINKIEKDAAPYVSAGSLPERPFAIWDKIFKFWQENYRPKPLGLSESECVYLVPAHPVPMAVARCTPLQIEQALEVAITCGSIDGDHHKAWVIDQMVRFLTGDQYAAIVTEAKAGEHGPDTYRWDEGIAP